MMLISTVCFAQDIISTKRGQRVQAIVTEITPTLVRYKLFSSPQGKVYFMYKDDVQGIMYQNGKVETFDHPEAQTIESNSSENQPQQVNPYVAPEENVETTTKQSINNTNQTSDLIQFRNGTTKVVSVVEITPELIKYRNYDNPNGALYSINKYDVAKITYQNGKEDVFAPNVNTVQQNDYQRTTNRNTYNSSQGTNSIVFDETPKKVKTSFQSIKNSSQLKNLVVGISPIKLLYDGLRIKLEKPMNEKVTYGVLLTGYYKYYPGVQLAPFARFYFKKRAPEGFYAQAKIVGGYYKSSYSYYDDDFNYIEKNEYFTSFGGGIAVGYQLLWGNNDRWTIDVNLGIKAVGSPPQYSGNSFGGSLMSAGNSIGWYATGPGSIIDGLVSVGYRF